MTIQAWLRLLFRVIIQILIHAVREPWYFLKFASRFKKSCGTKQKLHCVTLPEHVLRRPDPMIYSQSYLRSLGLAVVWDNPDFTLLYNGQPVDAHSLHPDTDYQVAIRVHNGSNQAPAFGVGLRLSYHLWGAGGPWIPIGQTSFDLPARGAPGEPVTVILDWHTPPQNQPGRVHWCLDAEIDYSNDLNPLNNVGQDNVDTLLGNAGDTMTIDIPIANARSVRRTFTLGMTGYSLPESPDYPPAPQDADKNYAAAIDSLSATSSLAQLIAASHVTGQPPVDNWTAYRSARVTGWAVGKGPKQFGEEWLARIIDGNSPERNPAPAEWYPSLSHDAITLAPQETASVQLRLSVPGNAPSGARQRFQVNAYDPQDGLIGGVEVLVMVR
jgi:hypothetical protein